MRRRRVRVWLPAMVLVALEMILLGGSLIYRAREGELIHGGVPVVGVIEDVDDVPRGQDRVKVSFAVNGVSHVVSIPVELNGHRRGEAIDLRYDAEDPDRVRTVREWMPPYLTFQLFATLVALPAVVVFARAWSHDHRLRRALAGHDRAWVWARWRVDPGVGGRHFIDLFETSPFRGTAVPIAAIPVVGISYAVDQERPIEAIGHVALGSTVILRSGDDTYWPSGRAQRVPQASTDQDA